MGVGVGVGVVVGEGVGVGVGVGIGEVGTLIKQLFGAVDPLESETVILAVFVPPVE